MRINESQIRKVVRSVIREQVGKEQSIEIDCAPGMMQQQNIYNQIAKKTGLPIDKEPDSTSFGNWVWYFDDVPAEEWAAGAAVRKQIISNAYHSGIIRYGSW